MFRIFPRRRAALRLLAALLLAPALAVAAEFVPGFEDLPLMPGLAVVPNAGVVFDKPDGRIVETVAAGPVGPAELASFYRSTLPQLGWSLLTETPRRIVFRREGEVLNIDHAESSAGLTVRFFLAPR